MNITASTTDLSAALAAIRAAVSARPSHPILATVLIDATTPGIARLSAFNLNLAITTAITAATTTEGITAVPYGLLAPLAAKLPAGMPCTLAVSGSRAVLATAGGEYSLQALDPAEWPAIPAPPDAATAAPYDADELRAAISAVSHAASRDESKAILQGIRLSGTAAAATDGHRLSRYGIANPDDAIVVPAAALSQLQHLQGDIHIAHGGGYITFSDGITTINSRLLDGTYPNIDALVPDSFKTTATVDRIALLHAVQRVAILADTQNNIIKLAIGDTLAITADVELGNGSEQLPIDRTGKPLTFAVNATYLADGLKAITTPRITLSANTPTTPVTLTPAESDTIQTYLIMPVQISG